MQSTNPVPIKCLKVGLLLVLDFVLTVRKTKGNFNLELWAVTQLSTHTIQQRALFSAQDRSPGRGSSVFSG